MGNGQSQRGDLDRPEASLHLALVGAARHIPDVTHSICGHRRNTDDVHRNRHQHCPLEHGAGRSPDRGKTAELPSHGYHPVANRSRYLSLDVTMEQRRPAGAGIRQTVLGLAY